MSQKSFAWYQFAVLNFPYATFISKADDDCYIRTIFYESTLRYFPSKEIYFGFGDIITVPLHSYVFYYNYGLCITMSMDVARIVATSTNSKPVNDIRMPLKQLLKPYRNRYKKMYTKYFFNAEDAMLGLLLYVYGAKFNAICDCRFVIPTIFNITEKDVIVYHGIYTREKWIEYWNKYQVTGLDTCIKTLKGNYRCPLKLNISYELPLNKFKVQGF